jgi:hypothetical protein
MPSYSHKFANFSPAMGLIKEAPEASPRDKPRWRESQRKLATADKVALLGQTILETLEFEKIKKHAKSL